MVLCVILVYMTQPVHLSKAFPVDHWKGGGLLDLRKKFNLYILKMDGLLYWQPFFPPRYTAFKKNEALISSSVIMLISIMLITSYHRSMYIFFFVKLVRCTIILIYSAAFILFFSLSLLFIMTIKYINLVFFLFIKKVVPQKKKKYFLVIYGIPRQEWWE